MTELPPLATASDYTDLIGPVPPGVDVDKLCASVSARVRAYCKWRIAPSTPETFTVKGSGTAKQFLPTLYLTGVTSVTDSGVALDLSVIGWDEAGWLEYPEEHFVSPGFFHRKARGIVATVTHGYETTPDDVVALVCSVVARHASSPTGAIREQAGAVSVAYSQVSSNASGGISLMQHEMDSLDSYRLSTVR